MDSVLKILMRMVGFSFKHSPEQCKVQFKTFSGRKLIEFKIFLKNKKLFPFSFLLPFKVVVKVLIKISELRTEYRFLLPFQTENVLEYWHRALNRSGVESVYTFLKLLKLFTEFINHSESKTEKSVEIQKKKEPKVFYF